MFCSQEYEFLTSRFEPFRSRSRACTILYCIMKAYPLYQRKRSFIYSILLTQCFYGHVLESLTLLITSLDQAPLTSQLIPRYLTRNLTYKKMRAKFCLTHLLHTSYAMLSSGLPWNMRRVTCIFRIRRVCIRRKYK